MSPTSHRAALLELVALGAILAISSAAHFRGLDRFVVDDERRWVCRAIDFRQAVAARDWGATFQVGHPGVVTMALAGMSLSPRAAGPWWDLCPTTRAGEDFSALDGEDQADLLRTMGGAIFAARRGIALASIVLLAGLYAVLRARLSAGLALSALAVLGLDPYLTGLTRVVHLDGVVALLGVLAMALLAAGGATAVVLSGMAVGAALLNKVSGVALAGAGLVWLAAEAATRRAPRWLVTRGGLWLGAAALTALLLWPALLTAPVATLHGVVAKTVAEAGEAHPAGVFFLGRVVGDPGAWFYPLTIALRATPATLVGVAVAAGWLLLRLRAPRPPALRFVAAGLLLAAVFGAELVLAPKKLDRYVAPVLAGLDLAAGLALGTVLVGAVSRLQTHGDASTPGRAAAGLAALGAAGLLVTPLAGVVRSHPYEIAYYDPLVGGARAAARLVTVGWGEGYDLAAAHLNAAPRAAEARVAASDQWTFGALFAGATRNGGSFKPGRTDHIVLYLSDAQRGLTELNGAVAGRAPSWTGYLFGVPFVRVYADPTAADARALVDALAAPGGVLIAPGDTPFARSYDGPLVLVRYWGHWHPADLAAALTELPEGASASPPTAWVVRYPALDSNIPAEVLTGWGGAESFHRALDGVVEVSSFVGWQPSADGPWRR